MLVGVRACGRPDGWATVSIADCPPLFLARCIPTSNLDCPRQSEGSGEPAPRVRYTNYTNRESERERERERESGVGGERGVVERVEGVLLIKDYHVLLIKVCS